MDVWRPRWMVLLLLTVAGQWSRLWCYLSAAAEHHAASHVEFAENRCGRRSAGNRIIRESWHQQPFRFLHGEPGALMSGTRSWPNHAFESGRAMKRRAAQRER